MATTRSDYKIHARAAKELIDSGGSIYITQAGELWSLFKDLPASHTWYFDTAESLALHERQGAGDAQALGLASLWEDISVLTLTLAWKVRQAALASVWALNRDFPQAAAMAARGAMEAAELSLATMISFEKTMEAFEANPFSAAAEAEWQKYETETVRKALWGRRGDTVTKNFDATNILSHQQTLSKYGAKYAEAAPEMTARLAHCYEVLSNLSHPNRDGHQAFWRMDGSILRNGTNITVVSSEVDPAQTHVRQGVEEILWALGWSAVSAVHAYGFALEHQFASVRHLEQPT